MNEHSAITVNAPDDARVTFIVDAELDNDTSVEERTIDLAGNNFDTLRAVVAAGLNTKPRDDTDVLLGELTVDDTITVTVGDRKLSGVELAEVAADGLVTIVSRGIEATQAEQ